MWDTTCQATSVVSLSSGAAVPVVCRQEKTEQHTHLIEGNVQANKISINIPPELL